MKGLRDLDGRAVEKQGLLGYAGGLPAAAVWNQQKLEIVYALVGMIADMLTVVRHMGRMVSIDRAAKQRQADRTTEDTMTASCAR